MIIEELTKLGLSREESKVYIACLEGKGLSVVDLARITGITRTTLYTPINSLLKKKLLSYIVSKKRKFLRAAPAKMLVELVDQELKDVLGKKDILVSLISSLEKKARNTTDGSVEIVEGKNGIEYLISAILASKSDFYWIGAFSIILSAIDKDSLYKLLTWKRMDGDTTSYAISDNTLLDYSRFSDKLGKFREVKILKDTIDMPGIIITFGDTISFISFSKRKKVKIFLIHDSLCADFYKFTFLELWKRI
jgi:sugar-specific transcriptional regulator TrmB